jgi:hypothetical protein
VNKSSFGLRCVAVIAALSLAPTLAQAYIDPGNGAYMVQVLFTLVGASLFYVRHPIRSLKAFGRWLLNRQKHSEELAPSDSEVEKPQVSGAIGRAGGNSSDAPEGL